MFEIFKQKYIDKNEKINPKEVKIKVKELSETLTPWDNKDFFTPNNNEIGDERSNSRAKINLSDLPPESP